MTRGEALNLAAETLKDARALLNTVGVPATEIGLYLTLADKYMILADKLTPD